jgi:hypothetical protein
MTRKIEARLKHARFIDRRPVLATVREHDGIAVVVGK